MNETLQKCYDDVVNALKCRHCKHLFEDPVLLRCGCLVCSDCIASGEIKTCCKKKVTEKDTQSKYHLLSDINNQVKEIGALFQQPGERSRNMDQVDEHVKQLAEVSASLRCVNEETSDVAATDNVLSENEHMLELIPPMLRHSSSATTIDGSKKCFPESCGDVVHATRDFSELQPEFPTQGTSQGGFVLDSQNQTLDFFYHRPDHERNIPEVEGKVFTGGSPARSTKYCYPTHVSKKSNYNQLPPRHDHRLYQHVEDVLMLTSSSATLSPTQVVEKLVHDEEAGGVVQDTFAMDYDDSVIAASLSPAGELPCGNGSNKLIISDSFAIATPSDNKHINTKSTAYKRNQVVCDTFKDPDDEYSFDVAADHTMKHSTPDSDMTHSSMYTVESCTEGVGSGAVNIPRVFGQNPARHPVAIGLRGSLHNKSKAPETVVNTDGSPNHGNDKAIVSTLESDWLNDNDSPSRSNQFADLKNDSSHNLIPLSPSVNVDVNLDLSIDFDVNDVPVGKRYEISSDANVASTTSTMHGCIGGIALGSKLASTADVNEDDDDGGDSSLYDVESEEIEYVERATFQEGQIQLTDACDLSVGSPMRVHNSRIDNESETVGIHGDWMRKKGSDTAHEDCGNMDSTNNTSTSRSTYNESEDLSGMATWAKKDNELLNKLSHLLDKNGENESGTSMRHKTQASNSQARCTPSEIHSLHNNRPDIANSSFTPKSELGIKSNTSFTSPSKVPHFAITCSTSVRCQITAMQDECEKLNIFTSHQGEWLKENEVEALKADSAAISFSCGIKSPGAATSCVSAHLLFVDAEKCNQVGSLCSDSVPIVCQCARTWSFMKALCMGYWIIDAPRWLKACLREGEVADLTKFEVSRALGAPLNAAPTRARLSPRQVDNPFKSVLFDKCIFLLRNFDDENEVKRSGYYRRFAGKTEKDNVVFLVYFGGGFSIDYPHGDTEITLCENCRLLRTSLYKNSVAIINFNPSRNTVSGSKRKATSSKYMRCFICENNVTMPVDNHFRIPEISLHWLLDSVSSFEKKPFDRYYTNEVKSRSID